MWCGGCAALTRSGDGFCFACREILGATSITDHRSICTSIPADVDAIALFRYESFLRKIVLRAKVKNDTAALRSLANLVATHPISLSMAHSADVIIPAPSSLWGRTRGRFDVAQALAKELSVATGKPMALMKPSSYITRSKRAGENAARSHDFKNRMIVKTGSLLDHFLAKPLPNGHILLVDDVLTTGFTMQTITKELTSSGERTVSGLVLASAWSQRSKARFSPSGAAIKS